MRKTILFITALLLFPHIAASQDFSTVNYYSEENILKFAEYLYQNGENERAVAEFCRVFALCADTKLKDTLAYRIAVGYLKLSKPVLARKYCADIPVDSTDSLLGARAACLYAYSYYVEKKFDSSSVYASYALMRMGEVEWQLHSAQIKAGALLQQYKWKEGAVEAEKAIQRFKGKGNDTLTRNLYAIGLEGTKLHMKNRGLAAVMSAVVPGSGKMYAGRTWDGLYSLLMIGIMAWQSYEGYHKDGLVSGRCMTFGLLGSAFYAGNIYGSISAADIYNRSQKKSLCDRIGLRFDW